MPQKAKVWFLKLRLTDDHIFGFVIARYDLNHRDFCVQSFCLVTIGHDPNNAVGSVVIREASGVADLVALGHTSMEGGSFLQCIRNCKMMRVHKNMTNLPKYNQGLQRRMKSVA